MPLIKIVSHITGGIVPEEISPAFINALLAEDEVGCVIRSHLYVEAQMDRYVELAVTAPKYLVKLDLSYAKKIELICCLGFDEHFRGALKRIGKIRNAFAHDLSSCITQQIVNDLYNTLPEFGRQAVQASVDKLHKALGLSGKPSKYQALPAKSQFVLIVLNLERICCAACDLLRNAQIGKG